MRTEHRFVAPGPFTADQLPTEQRYELHDGHPVWCAPTGERHAGGSTLAAGLLDTDPDVVAVGVDAGFKLSEKNLRAPDVAILPGTNKPGWIEGAPPLAVEYADGGQDEAELSSKIGEMLERGTQAVWVVRLTGPRRVEVHTPDGLVQLLRPGHQLTAPGIARNPIPVEAFYERGAAHQVMLRNLLNGLGYADLDAVIEAGWRKGAEAGKAEGKAEGKASALIELCALRGLSLRPTQVARALATRDEEVLDGWFRLAATAATGSALPIPD